MLGIFFGTHFNEDEKSISINGEPTLILGQSLRIVFSRSTCDFLISCSMLHKYWGSQHQVAAAVQVCDSPTERKACGTSSTSRTAHFFRRRWYKLTLAIITPTLTLTKHPLTFTAPCSTRSSWFRPQQRCSLHHFHHYRWMLDCWPATVIVADVCPLTSCGY